MFAGVFTTLLFLFSFCPGRGELLQTLIRLRERGKNQLKWSSSTAQNQFYRFDRREDERFRDLGY